MGNCEVIVSDYELRGERIPVRDTPGSLDIQNAKAGCALGNCLPQIT